MFRALILILFISSSQSFALDFKTCLLSIRSRLMKPGITAIRDQKRDIAHTMRLLQENPYIKKQLAEIFTLKSFHQEVLTSIEEGLAHLPESEWLKLNEILQSSDPNPWLKLDTGSRSLEFKSGDDVLRVTGNKAAYRKLNVDNNSSVYRVMSYADYEKYVKNKAQLIAPNKKSGVATVIDPHIDIVDGYGKLKPFSMKVDEVGPGLNVVTDPNALPVEYWEHYQKMDPQNRRPVIIKMKISNVMQANGSVYKDGLVNNDKALYIVFDGEIPYEVVQ